MTHQQGLPPPRALGTIQVLPEDVAGQRRAVYLQGLPLEALVRALQERAQGEDAAEAILLTLRRGAPNLPKLMVVDDYL